MMRSLISKILHQIVFAQIFLPKVALRSFFPKSAIFRTLFQPRGEAWLGAPARGRPGRHLPLFFDELLPDLDDLRAR
eukprot:2792671-Pleurochrysis_carterae.AAC.1